MSRAEEAALKVYPFLPTNVNNDVWDDNKEPRNIYKQGYEQAEKDIISLIESRLSELLGDAQPTPILRYELRDLINKIEEK